MWAHRIRNVGEEDVMTVLWAARLRDAESPDQYPLKVEEPS